MEPLQSLSSVSRISWREGGAPPGLFNNTQLMHNYKVIGLCVDKELLSVATYVVP